jgi:autotransporter passenger strand-loop-strand repeat protein
MTAYIVSAGQPASGLTLNSGDTMDVLSGGSAVNISMTSGSTMVVSGGGTAVSASLYGTVFDTGVTQPTISVLSGGITTGTVLGGVSGAFNAAPLGTEVVFAGGSAVDTLAQFNGLLVVSSGGSATSSTLVIGGVEAVLSGGVDQATKIDFGVEQVQGVAYGATISAYKGIASYQEVQSGGYASGTVVTGSGAELSVSAGGSDVATTVVGGGSALVAGAVSGLVLENGGAESVVSGGTTTNTLVQSGASETVYGGGVANGTTVQSGGTENISSGGTTSNTVVNSGGTQNLYFEGNAVDTISAPGAILYSALNMLVSAGVTSSGLNVGPTGVVAVFSGGTVDDTVVSNGGQLFVSSGGTEIATTLLGGAIAIVDDGTDSGTTFSGAGPLSGSDVPLFSSETIVSGGTAVGDMVLAGGRLLLSGATATGTVVNGTPTTPGGFGGDIEVFSGGATVSTTLIAVGEEQVTPGGTATGTVVYSGGVDSVEGGTDSATTVSSGGLLSIDAGSAVGAVVSNGGSLVDGSLIGAGALAIDATLLSGATGTVQGGTAINTVVEGGASLSVAFEVGNGVFPGATSNTTVESGAVLSVGVLGYSYNDTVEQGGSAVVGGAGFVSGMTLSGGTLTMSGGVGSGIAVLSGGTMSLAGSFPGATATVVYGGGVEILGANAADANDIVLSGGVVSVQSGGSAGDTVMGGGFVGVQSGGVAVAPVLSGGTVVVSSGGTIQGPQVLQSGSYVAGPGSVGFADVPGGTLVLGAAGVLSGVTVSGFVVGDTIDLLGMSGAGSAVLGAGNLLSVPVGGGQSIALQFDPTASFINEAFVFGSATVSGQEAESITLSSTIPTVAPAQESLTTPGTIVFPNVRVGGIDQASVGITNAAAALAGSLSVVPTASGAATASGTIAALAPGGSDTTDIVAGLNTAAAGALSGTVTLPGTSTAGGVATPLANAPTISLSGAIYREATGTVAPISLGTIHVGQGTVDLAAVTSNTAPNDGYSEALIATILSASGAISTTASPAGASGDIAPGKTGTATAIATVAAAAAGVETGTVDVGLTTDGGTGAGAIDGLGTASLGTIAVPVSVTVDNYAAAVVSAPGGSLTQTGTDTFVLNFGTVQAGAAVNPVTLTEANGAAAPADALDGAWSVSAGAGFANAGFAAFSTLAAGSALTAGTITLNTGQSGSFSETITLTPTDDNGAGFTQAQAPVTVTVKAVVLPAQAQGDVHMTTFDGLRYDFQALGAYVLARASAADDPFQVQIHTVAYPLNDLASVIDRVGARIGNDALSIGLDGALTVNGAADPALSLAGTTQLFDGGSVTALGGGAWSVGWAGGEAMTITTTGSLYLNVSVTLGQNEGPGSVQGLLGSDSGQASDIALPDGTVLTQPLSEATILGAFANAWTVAPDQSLLNGAIVAPLPAAPLGLNDSMVFAAATQAGEVLTGSLGAAAAGAAYQGTAATLAGDVLAGFAVGDRVDITDFSPLVATVAFVPNPVGGTVVVANASGAVRFGVEHLAAQVGFTVAADGHGGTIVTAVG